MLLAFTQGELLFIGGGFYRDAKGGQSGLPPRTPPALYWSPVLSAFILYSPVVVVVFSSLSCPPMECCVAGVWRSWCMCVSALGIFLISIWRGGGVKGNPLSLLNSFSMELFTLMVMMGCMFKTHTLFSPLGYWKQK